MDLPLVSIIVPCYNQAQYLSEALESVLAQTYSNWECIIVNDGSPDNTREVANDWVNRDKRFKYLEKENGGVSDARNKGIKLSKGEYILPLDADDKISKEYIELAIDAFKKDSTLKLVYCEIEFFGSKSGKVKLKQYNYKLLLEVNVIINSAIFQRSDFDNTNGYSIEMKEGFEDWSFWLDLLDPTDKVLQLPYILFYYRILPDSRNRSMSSFETYKLKNKIFTDNLTSYIDEGICFINVLHEYNNLCKSKEYLFGYAFFHPWYAMKKGVNFLFRKIYNLIS